MTKTISTNKVVEKIANEMYMQYVFIYQNSKRLSDDKCLFSSQMSYVSISTLRNTALMLGVLEEVAVKVNEAMGSERIAMESEYFKIKEIMSYREECY